MRYYTTLGLHSPGCRHQHQTVEDAQACIDACAHTLSDGDSRFIVAVDVEDRPVVIQVASVQILGGQAVEQPFMQLSGVDVFDWLNCLGRNIRSNFNY